MGMEITNRRDSGGYKVHRVLIVVECRHFTEDSEYSERTLITGKKKWATARYLAGRASRTMFKILTAAAVTCIYSILTIEQAYNQRGYAACGGEYLIIPFVFYAVYKTISFTDCLIHAVKQWILQRYVIVFGEEEREETKCLKE